jgi:GntR family transcriptional regulator
MSNIQQERKMDISFRNENTLSLIQRIKLEIQNAIIKGDIKPGEKLPSESDLAKQFSVSRNTVREAIVSLEKIGLVIKKRGIGTFVTKAQPLISGGIERLTGVTQVISDQGFIADSEIVEFEIITASEFISNTLEIEEGSEILFLKTLKKASNEPIAICIDYIPKVFLGKTIDPKLLYKSVFSGLQEHYNINIKFAECNLIPVLSNEETSGLLKLNINSPLIKLNQIHYDYENRKVIFSKSYFPEKMVFKLIRKRY